MENRKLLKQKAKENIKQHFFRNVILVFIASVLMSGGWSYVNILDTKSQTFLCCTSS